MLPILSAMRLSRRLEPFDSSDYLYEIKHDGFRGLAYMENGQCRLVSRNGNRFHRFGELERWILIGLGILMMLDAGTFEFLQSLS